METPRESNVIYVYSLYDKKELTRSRYFYFAILVRIVRLDENNAIYIILFGNYETVTSNICKNETSRQKQISISRLLLLEIIYTTKTKRKSRELVLLLRNGKMNHGS